MADTKNIDPKKMVICGIVDLIRHKVFYGHILQQLNKIFITDPKSDIQTMAVGKSINEFTLKLFVNLNFVLKLFENADTEDEGFNHLLGVLEHETLHLVFNHLTLQFSDKLRGNVAVDLVVNSCISNNQLPKDCMRPERYNFPPNKSAHWYYNKLRDNEEFKKDCVSNNFGVDGLFSDAISSHEMWEETAEDSILEEYVKDMIRKSKDLCGSDYGNIPSDVIDQIVDALKTKKPLISWQQVLRIFCASATESNLDYTVKKVSKRFGTRPGTRKEDVLNLVVAIDTSGSINNEQLVIFLNEVKWIWKNGALITIVECDAEIQRHYKYNGKWDGTIHGRGGTDLEPPLKWAERKYDALIYFTDFYAPKIEKRYNIPTLWVLTEDIDKENYPYAWGRKIKIETQNN